MPKGEKKEKPQKEKKAKPSKKEKDPNAPKKPLGPYMFFCKDKRGDVVKAHPDWKMGDIAKELGAQWSKLSDKDKEKYSKEAEADKKRYEKEMEKYQK